ncbi:unnamed protein product [Thelazia callipaeda]|uniref:Activin_recp domain-containing protein n=1 Tax=Thelazia callipaeda TaxID=103827 RepID=A0A0N5D640_THECL|nr:unnamed protein product [Thelazia callipaeda]
MGLTTQGWFTTSVLFITSLTFSFAQNDHCFRCANSFILMHWERFLPIQADDELVEDSTCTKIIEGSEVIRCSGPCLTLNVTLKEGNNTRIIDCQKKYYRRERYKNNQNRSCRNQTVEIRHRKLNAEYCFCYGSYCNGDMLEKERNSRKTKFQTKNRNGTINSSTDRYSLHIIQLIMLIANYVL